MKRRTTAWDVNPAQPDNHNRPATARVVLSRPETPNWQMSNQPMEKYCEPIIKHFYPAFDMRNVTDIVNYTCDDLIQIPVGYVKQMAAISREQEKERRGLYFAGEYMAHAHTGGACASGRTVARTIVKHWA
jgi:oxygen-dependent protoporphyrinogen oxidase